MPEDRWCLEHGLLLRRVRRELEEDPKNLNNQRGKKRVPTCCSPGCHQPRVPPDVFCYSCLDSGAVAEEVA